ncbi:MAG: hypothetical protein RL516_1430 [Bacteroidota bacterium]
MKKLILLLIILSNHSILNSQDLSKEDKTFKYDFGVFGGIAKTNLIFDDVLKIYKPQINKNIGISTSFNLSKSRKSFLRTGINYSQKGIISKEKTTFTDNNGNKIGESSSIFRNNYLQIPITYNYCIGKNVKYFFGLGFYYSRLITAVYDNSPRLLKIENAELPIDISDQYNNDDYGLITQLGLKFKIKSKISGTIILANEIGLSNIGNWDENLYFSKEIKTSSTNLTIGLNYGLK